MQGNTHRKYRHNGAATLDRQAASRVAGGATVGSGPAPHPGFHHLRCARGFRRHEPALQRMLLPPAGLGGVPSRMPMSNSARAGLIPSPSRLSHRMAADCHAQRWGWRRTRQTECPAGARQAAPSGDGRRRRGRGADRGWRRRGASSLRSRRAGRSTAAWRTCRVPSSVDRADRARLIIDAWPFACYGWAVRRGVPHEALPSARPQGPVASARRG
jgi:hypothetical protein